MSKRVSNKRGKHAGARCRRVRLGYHRRQRISNVERAIQAHRRKTFLGSPLDKVGKDALKALKGTLMKLLPKRPGRRGNR